MPKTKASRADSPVSHKKNSSFFTRHHRDWSLAEYLSYRHHPSRDPRRVIDSWRPALQNIASCVSKCHNNTQRARALHLLARYDEKGAGSDRSFGKSWLRDQLEKQMVAPSHTINNFTPVFNSGVRGSSITLNSGVRSADKSLESLAPQADPLDDLDYVDTEFDEDDDEGGDDDGEDGEEDNPPTLHHTSSISPTAERAIEALTATYKRQTHRWSLCSGREVETVLYENCRLMKFCDFTASLAPSFTIDLDDPTVKSWFKNDEWHEIEQSVPQLPLSDPAIIAMFRSLNRFKGCKTPADIRRVLATTSFLEQDQTYDSERDFLSMWADLVVRNLLVLWESPRCPLRNSQLEDFYSNLVWAPILDQCFLSFPSITIVRKESPCHSSAFRKNRTRTLKTHMRRGRRLDGVIRSIEDDAQEFGGMEVARSAAGGVKSTKRLGDEKKLLKALRDMLGVLCGLVKTKEMTRKLQVVGVLCAGLKMQVVRMGCWREGTVAVLYRETDVEVPVEITEFEELTKLLIMLASMKAVVAETVKAVRERHQGKSSVGKSDEELIREMIERPGVGINLGWAADTPSPEP